MILRVVAPPDVGLVEVSRENYDGRPAVRYLAAAPDTRIFWHTTSRMGDEVWYQEYES